MKYFSIEIKTEFPSEHSHFLLACSSLDYAKTLAYDEIFEMGKKYAESHNLTLDKYEDKCSANIVPISEKDFSAETNIRKYYDYTQNYN